MKTILRLLVLLIVVPSLVVGMIWFLDKRGVFDLDKIEISLEKNIEHPLFMRPLVAEVDRHFETLRGNSLWTLDLDQASQQIGSLPWVAELQIRRSWPDRLEVKIKPKEVKFLSMAKNGALLPILEDGTFLEAVAADNLPDVVLLRGNEFQTDRQLVLRALKTLAEIPADGSFSKKTISEIRYDQQEGFWATMMKEGLSVKLGDDQIATKAQRISQVIDYLDAHTLKGKVIDANLTNKVLVRLYNEASQKAFALSRQRRVTQL